MRLLSCHVNDILDTSPSQMVQSFLFPANKTRAPGPQFFTLKFRQLSTSAENENINLGQNEKTCNSPTTSETKMESQFKPQAVHKLKKASQEGT